MTRRSLALTAAVAVGLAFSGLALGRSVSLTQANAVPGSVGGRTVPTTVWFQGYLADSASGEPVNATYDVQASIYDSAVLGTQLWGPETHSSVVVTEGWFNIELGSIVGGLPAFDSPPYYLELSVNGETLTPRLKLASVPAAFRASSADESDEDWTIDGEDIYRTDGRVWIGLSTLLDGRSGSAPEGAGVGGRTMPSQQTVKFVSFSAAHEIASLGYLAPSTSCGPGLAGVEGDLFPVPACDGVGCGYDESNCGVRGVGVGDSYGFGVAGYTYGRAGALTGGVLGSDFEGTNWGALGYLDGSQTPWGVYTPYDACVGGTLSLPDGAAEGYVLTSDASGNATWQQVGSGGILPFYGEYGGSQHAFSVSYTGSELYDAGQFFIVDPNCDGHALYVHSAGTGAVIGGRQSNDTDSGGGVADFCILGTGNPSSVVEARTNGSGPAYYGASAGETAAEFYASSGSDHVLHVEYTGSGEVDPVAVYGGAAPSDARGIGGLFEGGYIGCMGQVSPSGGEGYIGVYGWVAGGSGVNIGVYGGASGDGSSGIVGEADAGASDSHAGLFIGDVDIDGTLTKTAGSFKIDHPLDPENKYLYHSFVESPDMKNVYDGVVTLDESGAAWVELPEWFEALNADFRYQLTPIGAPAPDLYIADEMESCRFRIAGGEPGLRVSWQVTGIRRDRYAQEHRIPVEEYKPPKERGKYLHPELYGAPQERRVWYDPGRREAAERLAERRSTHGLRPEQAGADQEK